MPPWIVPNRIGERNPKQYKGQKQGRADFGSRRGGFVAQVRDIRRYGTNTVYKTSQKHFSQLIPPAHGHGAVELMDQLTYWKRSRHGAHVSAIDFPLLARLIGRFGCFMR